MAELPKKDIKTVLLLLQSDMELLKTNLLNVQKDLERVKSSRESTENLKANYTNFVDKTYNKNCEDIKAKFEAHKAKFDEYDAKLSELKSSLEF